MHGETARAPRDERDALMSTAREVVAAEMPTPLRLTPLRSSAPTLPDTTTKLLGTDARGRRRAVVLCGRGEAAEPVRRAARRAREVADALGPALGAHVLLPRAAGERDGVAFALYPYARPFRRGRVLRRLDAWRSGRRVLAWLRAATAATRRVPEGDAVASGFTSPLRTLAEDPDLPAPLRGEARRALDRLAGGRFAPCHVVTHYDLWTGNLLAPTPAQRRAVSPPLPGFVVIDWAGAALAGYGIFDLLRLGSALGLSRPGLRRELEAHCRILGCAPEDARTHLVAALAALARRLEHFPKPRFVAMAQRCRALLDAAEAPR